MKKWFIKFINKHLLWNYKVIPKTPAADMIVFIMSRINPDVLVSHSYNDWELEKLRLTSPHYKKFLTTKEVKELENQAYHVYNIVIMDDL